MNRLGNKTEKKENSTNVKRDIYNEVTITIKINDKIRTWKYTTTISNK